MVKVLIDFDNYFPHEIKAEKLEFVFQKIIELILERIEIIDKIEIGLYGGWYSDNFTQRASNLIQTLAQVNLFPFLRERKVISGEINLITNINGVDHIWKNTYREKRGLPKLRIDNSVLNSTCDNHNQTCPIKILRNFTKSRQHTCHHTDCANIQSDVFFAMEQKMVDTMIACDIITYSDSPYVNAVVVATDDVDIFPALTLGGVKASDKPIVLCILNPQNVNNYNQILKQYGVETFLIQ